MKQSLLLILLTACSGHDPREPDVVFEDASAEEAGHAALAAWLSLPVAPHITDACTGERACFRIRTGGAPAGYSGWSTTHYGSGDCEISTGELAGAPLWRVIAHEFGHCLGLNHTTARCGDGAPDIMNIGDQDGMRVCEPTTREFGELYR